MDRKITYIQLYLRLALGIGFLIPGLDRLGIWGPPGGPHISWGDWAHFSAYAHKVMSFLPGGLAGFMAVLATAGEITFGTLMVIGLFTRWAAIGAGVLTFCFAVSMAVSFGIEAPFNYSVFAFSGGSLLLSTVPQYGWSLDAVLRRK